MHEFSDSEDDCRMEEEKNKEFIQSNKCLKILGWTDFPLRPYQQDGVNWLLKNYKKGHGSILGDEMGLGKTCQTIACLAYKKKQSKKCQHDLIVCPRSLLENWQMEFKRFCPSLRVECFIGDKEERGKLSERLLSNTHSGSSFDILITTYELCLKDSMFLSSIDWDTLVVDEAHRLKNKDSQLHMTLKNWNTKHRLLLTGTPVQNNLQELYALLSFIDPPSFRRSKMEEFLEKFNDVNNSKSLSKELHKILKPYLLRRTKANVLKDLPLKSDVILYHGMSKLQKKLYKAILTKDLDAFEFNSYSTGGAPPRMMNILMQLRKCINHPYLFDGVEPEPFVLGEHLVEASEKLVLIDKLLSNLYGNGHKVLLFSQMTRMLDLLQDYLGFRDYAYERLDGSVRGEERFLAVRNFNENSDTFVFLLSTKAGGQGLNLVAADTVIFVDSDFNPQNDLQAAARAHRIGQTRPVKIIRLIGRNTVEEIILKRAEDKLKLTEKVIEEGQFSLGASKTSLITDDKVKLQDILKFGVDALLNEKESETTDVDFNKLLGATINGEWQLEEDVSPGGASVDNTVADESLSSMYIFEGKDYSKEPTAEDKKAFDELLSAERAVMEEQMVGERSLRKKGSMLLGPLPETQRKARKQLTPEELEERRKKRKEAAERRAQLEEEEEMKQAELRRKRKEAKWAKHGYISSRVDIDSDEDEDDTEDYHLSDDEDEKSHDSHSIHYVSGDVTHPIKTSTSLNLIVHCADDSGYWGKGGIFSALSRRSDAPQEQYELAAKMQDIVVGDCHLISLDNKDEESDTEDWLTLLIAQHRDRKNNLSGVKLSALESGLKAVHFLAKARKGSVHLPRIGYDTPGFNWYGTERLIKKHLAAKGIPTYIYYYPRKQHLKKKRKAENDEVTEDEKKKQKAAKTSANSRPSGGSDLPNIFKGIHAYICPEKMDKDQLRKYKRYLIAYDADVDKDPTDSTTHIIASKECPKKNLLTLKQSHGSIPIVSSDWLDQCLQKGKCLDTTPYLISLE